MSVTGTPKPSVNKRNGQPSHLKLDATPPHSFSAATQASQGQGEDGVPYTTRVVNWTPTELRIRLTGSKNRARDILDDAPPPPDGTVTISLTNVVIPTGTVSLDVPVAVTYVEEP
jgi:hypothetical protein